MVTGHPSDPKQPKKKRQHFVPKLLLRRFGRDRREAVSVFLVERHAIVPSAAITGQCQEAYFYGKDEAAENRLERIEDEVSILLDRAEKEEDVGAEGRRVLAKFAHLQLLRTRAWVDVIDLQRSLMMDDIEGSAPTHEVREQLAPLCQRE